MESIDYATKAPCGHAFHFECLFRWGRQHNSCPLCRGRLLEAEEQEETHSLVIDTGVGGVGRSFTVDTLMNRTHVWRRNIRRELEMMYRARPLSQYTGDFPDPLDVELVVRQTRVSRHRATVFLKYFDGDIVETIMFLAMSTEGELAIPPYRSRGGASSTEPYVQRYHKDRMIYEGRATGYESS